MGKSYSSKWIIQRITALLLVPLTFWFIFHSISFQHANYFEILLFFNSYINSFLFLIMMIAMLVHAKLGCETIVEDYVSSINLNKSIKSLINLITLFMIIISIIAIIKITIF